VKTIKQVADEIGVSKQAINKRLSQLPPTEVTTNGRGVKLIGVDGERVLKNLISPTANQLPPTQPPTNHQPPPTENELYKMLKAELDVKNEQLKVKDEQLSEKDRQIEKLTDTVRIQAESINADRKNELAETLIDGQKKLLIEDKPKKRGWQFWKKQEPK
jgi:hypothetical protein